MNVVCSGYWNTDVGGVSLGTAARLRVVRMHIQANLLKVWVRIPSRVLSNHQLAIAAWCVKVELV